MEPENFLFGISVAGLFETHLVDFVLALIFFTALAYGILSPRFGHHRSSIVVSGSVGLALSIGLVWWEQSAKVSVRNLGPVAVVFIILLLATVMFQAIRKVGGAWAAGGVGIGMSLVMSKILGIRWPIDEVVVQSITIAALVIGVLAFIFRFHHKDASDWVAPHFAARDLASIKHDMSDLYRDRHIHENISHNLRQLRERTNLAPANPDEAENIVFQIRRILSSEDWLTRRLAALRKRAKAMRDGHLNRIEELQHLKKRLPPRAKKQLANELKARYNELQFETKLEGLANTLAKMNSTLKR